MNVPSSSCPACGGRTIVANALNGSPEECPICQGGGNDLPFWYLVAQPGNNTVTIAVASSTIQQTIQIDNDFDFICDRIIANSTGVFSVAAVDKFRSQWMFGSSQVAPVNGENCSGTAQLPFWLPRKVRFPKQSSIQFYFTDRTGNANNIIQFCLVGYKDVSTGAASTTS